MMCICGHLKREHDADGMCTVDYLLCACAEYIDNNPSFT